ncbi:MAG: AAA family ATPase [bacterium]|nr:AAA family ATPase [bacterium]
MNKQILRAKNRNQKSSVKILAFVGMAGAGKSEATEYLKSKGYPQVYFGGVVMQALEQAGLEANAANEKRMRMELREKFGEEIIAQKIIEQINGLISAGQKRIVADGLYTWTEYKVLKKAFPQELKVVALVPPKSLRYKRLADLPERSLTLAEATDRDYHEIEALEKGGPIAMADYFIVNKNSNLRTRMKIDQILREIDF